MKKSKFTEEHIAFALRQAEHGTKVVEFCRKMGVSEQTFYRWKKQYSGMGPSELRRLKQLEEENRKLKLLVADLSLDKAMLRDIIAKKLLAPDQRRGLVRHMLEAFQVSERRACQVAKVYRSLFRYQCQAGDQAFLRKIIREIAATGVRCAFR